MFTLPTSNAKVSGRYCSIAGEGWAIIAIKSAFPVTRFRFGNRWPWFTATAANVGYAYWSQDIGGHMPGAVDPELYTRWVQFGVFSPILRTHTTENPESERRIWAYPEPYSDIMRRAFRLRYALEPYIYTEARQIYDTGVAFLHPLYYEWPEAEEAYASKGEYVFGRNMLVAPVVKPIEADRRWRRRAFGFR